MGHGAHRRGELQPVLRQPQRPGGRPPPAGQPGPLRHPRRGERAPVGGLPRPLRRRQGAQRAQSLRLDHGGRPLRSRARPGQAHRPGPAEARGGRRDAGAQRALGLLHRRRRALRVPLQVRQHRELRPRQPGPQPDPAGRRDALRRPPERRRHGAVAAPGLRAGPADPGQRLLLPGGRAHPGPLRRGRPGGDQDGPAGGRRGQPRQPPGVHELHEQHQPGGVRRSRARTRPTRARRTSTAT